MGAATALGPLRRLWGGQRGRRWLEGGEGGGSGDEKGRVASVRLGGAEGDWGSGGGEVGGAQQRRDTVAAARKRSSEAAARKRMGRGRNAEAQKLAGGVDAKRPRSPAVARACSPYAGHLAMEGQKCMCAYVHRNTYGPNSNNPPPIPSQVAKMMIRTIVLQCC